MHSKEIVWLDLYICKLRNSFSDEDQSLAKVIQESGAVYKKKNKEGAKEKNRVHSRIFSEAWVGVGSLRTPRNSETEAFENTF